MTPARRVAGAITAGEVTRAEGEQLLGWLALTDLDRTGPLVPDRAWSPATWYRRQALARRLGLA